MRATAVALAIAAAASAAAAADIEVRRDGSKAVDVPVVLSAPADTADGFDLGDAGVGAAGMLVVGLGLAGVVSLRARRHSSPPVAAG